MPFFLMPLAIAAKAVAVHLARTTVVQMALAAGSIAIAVSVINSPALGAIVFYDKIEEYRELNHLDQNGERKTEFDQIEKCDSCACSDFSFGRSESGTAFCVCGHAWGGHSYKSVDDIKEEFREYAKEVGMDTDKTTFEDAMNHSPAATAAEEPLAKTATESSPVSGQLLSSRLASLFPPPSIRPTAAPEPPLSPES